MDNMLKIIPGPDPTKPSRRWIAFPITHPDGGLIHTVRFDGGIEWSAEKGWRRNGRKLKGARTEPSLVG